ncbi:hypothetical protein M569_02016, partial [Genlisea aurea]
MSRGSDSGVFCRCDVGGGNSENDSDSGSHDPWRLDFGIGKTFRNAVNRIESYLNYFSNRRVESGGAMPAEINEVGEVEEDEEWNWERWMKHFVDVDEQERIISILKGQLEVAIDGEDYADAARIKLAIAAASTNDTVGRVLSHMEKFVGEELYRDAALLRDYGGAGLVGWWAGISDDPGDPYGCVIQISAEYGRYIARSYSPRQLATASGGSPLFELYLRETTNGDYQEQAVYLKRKEASGDPYDRSFHPSSSSRNLDSRDLKDFTTTLSEESSEDTEDSEDKGDDLSSDTILYDMIPGMKMKVLRVTAPEKVDEGIISKVIEQIIQDEEDEKDDDFDVLESGDESKNETSEEDDTDIELDSSGDGITLEDGRNQIAVKVVVSDLLLRKISDSGHATKDFIRVPALLEKKGRMSFTFNVEEHGNGHPSSVNPHLPKIKISKLRGQRSVDHVVVDLVKAIGKGKIPMKVLRDVGDLVNLTLNQVRNYQPLGASTTFNRIYVSSSADPLNGLYIGAHGMYTSEIIHMKRKFGQWKDDASKKTPSKLEFYEYVEAIKITGDAYVPAGQVAFRAKVGKGFQLPHKGIIPEEFGVIARYRGQGRLAEPGFRNPRWVDGELVVLDGK